MKKSAKNGDASLAENANKKVRKGEPGINDDEGRTMSELTLEARVAELEKQMTELRTELEQGVRPKDWRRTIGMFAGDEMMKQIDEEGRKIREADRQRAKKAFGKAKQRAKKR